METENIKRNYFKEAIETLTKPKEYFAKMPKDGGYGEPVVKALVYGVIISILSYINTTFFTPDFPFAGELTHKLLSLSILIGTLLGILLAVFAGGIITMAISAICKGNTRYEAGIRVVASLIVVQIAGGLFGFLSAISFTLNFLVSLIIALYGVYLFYIAITHSLSANRKRAKTVAGILAILIIVINLFYMAVTKSKIDKMIKNPEMEQILEKMKNKMPAENAEELKKFEEEMKKLQDEMSDRM